MLARARRQYLPPAQLALGAAAASREHEAIQHTREAFEIRDPTCQVFFSRHLPYSAPLYAYPRFREIIASMGRVTTGCRLLAAQRATGAITADYASYSEIGARLSIARVMAAFLRPYLVPGGDHRWQPKGANAKQQNASDEYWERSNVGRPADVN